MGFLDSKERIIDFQLTNLGREKLSKNQLNFSYYAFSDEGIDYSGSFVAASGSLDDYIFRNLSFESDQRKNSLGLEKNTSLKSFLFTVPSNSQVIPEFTSNVDHESEVSLKRKYFIDPFFLSFTAKTMKARNQTRKPHGVVIRGTIPKEDFESRIRTYINLQFGHKIEERLVNGKSIVGLPIGENLIVVSKNKVVDVTTGASFLISEMEKTKEKQLVTAMSLLKTAVEVIDGIDKKKVNFKLKTSEGEIEASNGFLVEVYLSGSDGRLTKLIQEDVKNPLTDDTLVQGFSSFLKLGIDK